MKKIPLLPTLAAAVITALSLTGCSSITDRIQNEKSGEFTSVQELTRNGTQTAAWLPADATEIKTQEATTGDTAVLAATSETDLDTAVCAETDRRSAPAYAQPWSPEDVYVDRVFACGDWAVMKTDDGWYGWTPNDPDEKAVSPAQ